MGYAIEASSVIAAPIEDVWRVLVDLDGYAEWNPFTPRVRSGLEVGDDVELDVVLGPRRRTRSINHVERIEAPTTIVWSSTLIGPTFLRTRRTQRIIDLGDGRVRYSTHEVFEGLLAPLVRLVSERAVRAGFEAVADALRQRVESARG
jgi:hypothetical protein